MILLVSLGYWQLGRAEEKSVFLEKQRQSGVAEVLEAQALVANNAVDYRYRKVELTGYYDA
ncbi:MAG: SURF1 family cytochrome oxidase biogenesis protein, partial [Methylococcales bacterium]